MSEVSETRPASPSFDDAVVPHLDAARRVARWLLRNESDADDAVQEASLRALRYFESFKGGNARSWFLRIVRNTCYQLYVKQSRHEGDVFDEVLHAERTVSHDPEALLIQRDVHKLVERALDDLPQRARRLLVKRELEGLSYQEVSEALGLPLGTVMSGLSRARRALRIAVEHELQPPAWPPEAVDVNEQVEQVA